MILLSPHDSAIGFEDVGSIAGAADRCAASVEGVHTVVDEPELPVPVGMRRSFEGLVARLQAVAIGVQQLANLLRTHLEALRAQFFGELSGALRRPPQRQVGVSASHGVHQRFEREGQSPDSSTRCREGHPLDAVPARRPQGSPLPQLFRALADGRSRHSGRSLDHRGAAVSENIRVGSRPQFE